MSTTSSTGITRMGASPKTRGTRGTLDTRGTYSNLLSNLIYSLYAEEVYCYRSRRFNAWGFLLASYQT